MPGAVIDLERRGVAPLALAHPGQLYPRLAGSVSKQLEKSELSNFANVLVEPREEGFVASVAFAHLSRLNDNPDLSLKNACAAYGRAIDAMREVLAEIDDLKSRRSPIPARVMWKLGDAVVNLGNDLEAESMELDGLNDHLVRDLNINAKRMGTIVTFRRHLPDVEVIPESLGWSQCEKQARKVAQELKTAVPTEDQDPC